MSAVVKDLPRLVPMTEADLDAVVQIEQTVYTHPWTRGNFSDSVRAGYTCWTCRHGADLAGYAIVTVAAGEAHLLNLSVAPEYQRRGIGSSLLQEVLRAAREQMARHVFLEVRPSNDAARAIYARFGFRRIALRCGYYPAHAGREDALVLTLDL